MRKLYLVPTYLTESNLGTFTIGNLLMAYLFRIASFEWLCLNRYGSDPAKYNKYVQPLSIHTRWFITKGSVVSPFLLFSRASQQSIFYTYLPLLLRVAMCHWQQ